MLEHAAGQRGASRDEQALALCPDEPRLLEREGHLLRRLGRDDEAIGGLRRSLELRPQQPDLRAYLRQIESERRGRASGGDWPALARTWRRAWAGPMGRLLGAAARPSSPREGGRATTRPGCFSNLAVTRVHPTA